MSMSETAMSGWKQSAIVFASAILSLLAPRAVLAQELCGQTTDADIVIMIDLTGSISNSALGLERDAAKTLLTCSRPRAPDRAWPSARSMDRATDLRRVIAPA